VSLALGKVNNARHSYLPWPLSMSSSGTELPSASSLWVKVVSHSQFILLRQITDTCGQVERQQEREETATWGLRKT
jgi:hypothetical protein